MRYSLLYGAAFAALALGAVSAHGQVLMYSFETGDTPNGKDGFVPNGLLPSQSTTGATIGSDALQLVSPSGGYADAYTQTDLPAVLGNPALSAITMDVTTTSAYAGNYSNLFFGFFISNPGEGEYGDTYTPPNTDWPNTIPDGQTPASAAFIAEVMKGSVIASMASWLTTAETYW